MVGNDRFAARLISSCRSYGSRPPRTTSRVNLRAARTAERCSYFDRNGGLHENPGQFERLWDKVWRDPLGPAGDHPMREYLRLMDQFVPGSAPGATTMAGP
jgi:hypothetical protein